MHGASSSLGFPFPLGRRFRLVKKIVLYGSSALFGIGCIFFPTLLLIYAIGLLAWVVRYDITFLQSLPQRRWLLAAFALALTVGAVVSATQSANAEGFPFLLGQTQPSGSSGFSFLFERTQQVLSNCVLRSVAGLAVLSGVLFGTLRVAFMVGIGVAGYKIWQSRRDGQDYQEMLAITITAILVVVVIGVIEPLIVGNGQC